MSMLTDSVYLMKWVCWLYDNMLTIGIMQDLNHSYLTLHFIHSNTSPVTLSQCVVRVALDTLHSVIWETVHSSQEKLFTYSSVQWFFTYQVQSGPQVFTSRITTDLHLRLGSFHVKPACGFLDRWVQSLFWHGLGWHTHYIDMLPLGISYNHY